MSQVLPINHESGKNTVLERFAVLSERTHCPYALAAKVYAGPEWITTSSIEDNVSTILPFLNEFIETGEREKADLFVIEVTDPSYIQDLRSFSVLLNRVLSLLRAADPTTHEALTAGIGSLEWDFFYRGVRFFVPTFAPFYEASHPRYSHQSNSAFIVLQPDFSFDRHGIHSRSPDRQRITEAVRRRFEAAGAPYDISLVADSIKAVRYIKPKTQGEAPVEWWKCD